MAHKNARDKLAPISHHSGQNRSQPPQTRAFNVQRWMSFGLTLLIMALFWVLFSGRFDGFHLILGLFACVIVAAMSSDLLFPAPVPRRLWGCWIRFGLYIPWLIYQIFLANLHVLYLVFHPKMMERIDPHIIEFDSRLKSDVARTTFANSITLTPGTITVHVNVLGRFAVHCIDKPAGQSLPGAMETRVARIFEE